MQTLGWPKWVRVWRGVKANDSGRGDKVDVNGRNAAVPGAGGSHAVVDEPGLREQGRLLVGRNCRVQVRRGGRPAADSSMMTKALPFEENEELPVDVGRVESHG